MAPENVEVVRRAWDGWIRDRWEGLVPYLDGDVIWDTSHFHDWPESTYYGRKGVERFLTEWLDVWDDYEVEVEEILSAPDGRVVVVSRQRGKGRVSELDMEMRAGQINTVRDGKITRAENYEDPAEALEAAGLSE